MKPRGPDQACVLKELDMIQRAEMPLQVKMGIQVPGCRSPTELRVQNTVIRVTSLRKTDLKCKNKL